VLGLRRTDRDKDDEVSGSRVLPFPAALERTSRTFICTVLFLDIAEYSKKPVSEQLKSKEQFNARISEAIQDITVTDRIILDTGDGAAVNFLGDPQDALLVAMKLARSFTHAADDGVRLDVRMGINLGPVQLVRDINGQPNIVGDGINVAQRVMSFARPGQVLVSRSYYEVVTRLSNDYAQLFAYQGSRTDKHVREHEIYEITAAAGDLLQSPAHRPQAPPEDDSPGADAADDSTPRAGEHRSSWVRNRMLALATAALSCAALTAAIVLVRHAPEPRAAAPAEQPAPVAAPKPLEAPPAPAVAETPVANERDAAQSSSPASEPEAPVESSKPPVEPKPTPARRHARRPAPTAAKSAVHKERPQTRPEPEATADAAPRLAPPVSAPAPVGTPPTPAAGPTALITLAVSPWGMVVVDGEEVGVSPPRTELELAPGKHRIEIRNGSFKPYIEILQLKPNQTLRIKHKFSDN